MPPCTHPSAGLILALALAALLVPRCPSADPAAEVTFFVTADPQVNIPRWGTAGTEHTIMVMNALPGQPFPPGGTVQEPRGVLVLGDLVDDISNRANWDRYKRFFDPQGEALLRFKAIEVIGNHDLSLADAGGFSYVQREVIERNQRREEAFAYDAHRYHYSWDWGALHLVNLNLFPGNRPRPVYDREAPWNDPKDSLRFLEEDLKERVGDSGRPVIVMWHYGLRGWGREKWWTEEDLAALKAVLEPYNVALILHGHEHAFAQYVWEGHDVFMAPSPQKDRDPKNPQLDSTPKGFLVVRLQGDQLQVVHHKVTGWGESWSKRIGLGRAGR
jgi:hypothetical protein